MAWTASSSRIQPSPTRANCTAIASGTSAARNRAAGDGLKKSQHRTNSGPVPMWMILRLVRESINPLAAAAFISRSHPRATAKVRPVATKSWTQTFGNRVSRNIGALWGRSPARVDGTPLDVNVGGGPPTSREKETPPDPRGPDPGVAATLTAGQGTVNPF